MSRTWLIWLGLALAACSANPPSPLSLQSTPLALSPAPTPLPTLPVVIPDDPPRDCGPEAAIALAQTQSDLALAADSRVEALQQANAGETAVAQSGQQEYGAARDLMKAYDVPECLLQAKVFADQFFAERIEAYKALAAEDRAGYEMHLNNGELARQNMITAVNGVLGE